MTENSTGHTIDSAALFDHIKSVSDYVVDCERRARQGEIMDLQGLDRNVTDICNTLAQMERGEAQKLQSRLATLIEGLERLGDTMREEQKKQTGTAGIS